MQSQVIDRPVTGYDERFQYSRTFERPLERTRPVEHAQNISAGILLARMISMTIAACFVIAAILGGLCAYTENLEVSTKLTNYEITRADEQINELKNEIDQIYNNILINGQINAMESQVAANCFFVTDTIETGG